MSEFGETPPDFEPVIPDQLFRVNIDGAKEAGAPEYVMVNAKYDRLDFYTRFGQYVLKAFDDEYGLMAMYIDEDTAFRIQEHAGLPIVPRDQIYESEFNGYVETQAHQVDDTWLDD